MTLRSTASSAVECTIVGISAKLVLAPLIPTWQAGLGSKLVRYSMVAMVREVSAFPISFVNLSLNAML